MNFEQATHRTYRFIAAFFMLPLLFALNASAAPSEVADSLSGTFTIRFAVGKSVINPAIADNAAVLKALDKFLEDTGQMADAEMCSVDLIGSASPEGSSSINERLATERLDALRHYISARVSIPDSLLSFAYRPGNGEEEYNRLASQGLTRKQILPLMRYATCAISFGRIPQPEPEVIPEPEPESEPVVEEEVIEEPVVEPEPEPEPEPDPIEDLPDLCDYRSWYVKTNFVGWALLSSNLAVEYDVARRWSVALPIYYTACNFFRITAKLRNLTIMPEVRYWFDNQGPWCRNHWFISAHVGVGWFNVAHHGVYRYQSDGKRNPAVGGGIGGGWRFNLSKGGSWKMEFTTSVGVYHAKYNKFANTYNGQKKVAGITRTWFGVDNVGITIIYAIPTKNRPQR